MEISKYYELLQPKQGEKVLLIGEKSLPIGLYIAGKGKKNDKRFYVHSLISEGALVTSERKELEIARREFPEHLEFIEGGLPYCSFEMNDLLAYNSSDKYNYAIIKKKEFSSQELLKLSGLMNGGKVLLLLDRKYFKLMESSQKKMFGSNSIDLTFRKFLQKVGFTIETYDIDEDELIFLGSFKKLDKKAIEAGFRIHSEETFGKKIIAEIEKSIQFTTDGSRFAIKSGDGEYLYLLTIMNTKNQPFNYYFTFLDGKFEYASGETRSRSKNFYVIVLPNTNTFKKEIESKDILILTKKRVLELFGERYVPFS